MNSLPASNLESSGTPANKIRDAAIDHIRIVLTGLVIFHHVAIVYGGSGGWYWREVPEASNQILLMFNAFNQAFFMGFFFLLAGYFTPASFDRKGPGRYIKERLLRLGVPLLFYFFLLSTFTEALAETEGGVPLARGWLDAIRSREFGPGPLWFVEALLLFAGAYAIWRKVRPARMFTSELPSFWTLALTGLSLGVISFLIRLLVPVGQEVAWLQIGYFPCYVYLFAGGCVASRKRVLEKITFSQALPWMLVSLMAVGMLPLVMIFRSGKGAFEGGWSLNALIYALWDPFVAWGVILGMLWAFRAHLSRATKLTDWLSTNAYGAYIVHPPVVVGASLAAATWTQGPLLKFAVVGTAACIGSFLVASALRSIPGARRIT